MAMRSQVYEWANLATGTNGSSIRRVADAVPQAIAADTSIDIFIGGTGNNITKPAETTATQFVVIEDVACSAYRGGAVQVRINTTDYFQNPDVPPPARRFRQGDGRFDAPPDWAERSQCICAGHSTPPPLALTAQDSVPRQTATHSGGHCAGGYA